LHEQNSLQISAVQAPLLIPNVEILEATALQKTCYEKIHVKYHGYLSLLLSMLLNITIAPKSLMRLSYHQITVFSET